MNPANRRSFIKGTIAAAAAGVGVAPNLGNAAAPKIQGFEEEKATSETSRGWQPVSDRKIRVGIVGYGYCKFGAIFGFQDHPNVEVVAVSDLFPDRCAALAERCGCEKTYPSLEELVKDDKVEAVWVATDAPSHCEHTMTCLKHGKHVAVAVPAVWGSLEDAERLYEAVTASGLHYMMFETSFYHAANHAMRQVYRAGGFGKVMYAEGAYVHYLPKPLPGYRNWRFGSIPMWYPTHADVYYVGVTGGSFLEVSCLGIPSLQSSRQPENNQYKNPFGTQTALYRTSEGGMARMLQSRDAPGAHGGCRIMGQKGSMTTASNYSGKLKELPDLKRPPLPPGMDPGGHGGSHGQLTEEFVRSILEDRKPAIDIATALNMTCGGIVAHQSALKDGERMKVPQYRWS